MFGRRIIEPDFERKPVYDNVYHFDGRWQSFPCSQCGASISLDLMNYIGQGADPEDVLGREAGDLVRNHFGILRRSLTNGWPKLRVESCTACASRYLVYVAEFEPSNGWCQGVLQGVTELVLSTDG